MMDAEHRHRIVALTLAVEAALIPLALFLGWILGQRVLEQIKWSWSGLTIGAAATIPMIMMFYLCIRRPIGPLEGIRNFVDQFVGPLFQDCTVLQLALLSVLAGLGEELLFRGVLQEALRAELGLWPAVLLTNVAFGLLHMITPAYAVLAGSLGLYLSALYVYSTSLLPPILAHGLYDFVVLLCVCSRPGPPEPEESNDAPGPEEDSAA